MAPDKKDKKRKAAAATADLPTKKTKKVEAKAAEPAKEAPKSILKKSKANGSTKEGKASKPKADGEAPTPIKPRKRAADYMSDEDSDAEVEDVPAKKTEKDTKSKPSAKKTKQENGTAASVKEKSAKSGKKAAKKAEIESSDSEDQGVALDAGESEDEEEDQTTALIRGFESSGDEDESADEAIDPEAPVPKIPDSKKAKRKILKMQKQNKIEAPTEKPGVVYVGRIPHGFYEHQMRSYFAQFGDITRLRLSRNRYTGRSKHYAFIEFASESVAKIVAATMDNYLMYGHILKCKYVPSEQVHPELWKGANRRFKATPWNRIEQKRLNKGKTREKWTKNIEEEQNRRVAKAEKLKELGYDFKLPKLKSVDDVPVQQAIEGEEPKPVESGEEAKAIEAPVEPENEKVDVESEKADDTPKKSKKEKKDKKDKKEKKDKKAEVEPEAPVEPPKPKEAATSPATKTKKKSKSKTKA